MVRSETLNTPRVVTLFAGYQDLYKRAQDRLTEKGQVEYVHTELESIGLLTVDLPTRLKQLITIAAQIPMISVDATFGHFKKHQTLKPTFSFDIAWERGDSYGNKSIIDKLHFGIPEEPQDTLIDNFFPSDSKTAYSSVGPHIGHFSGVSLPEVPDELRDAVDRYRQMEDLMKNMDFQIGVAEELGSLPYK